MLTRSPNEAISHWLTRVLLWEVAAAVIMGAILGYVAGRLLLWAEAKQTIEKNSFLAYTVALSLAVLGLVKLLGSDGILAVFSTGIMFSIKSITALHEEIAALRTDIQALSRQKLQE